MLDALEKLYICREPALLCLREQGCSYTYYYAASSTHIHAAAFKRCCCYSIAAGYTCFTYIVMAAVAAAARLRHVAYIAVLMLRYYTLLKYIYGRHCHAIQALNIIRRL